jgi:hypothetical protein
MHAHSCAPHTHTPFAPAAADTLLLSLLTNPKHMPDKSTATGTHHAECLQAALQVALDSAGQLGGVSSNASAVKAHRAHLAAAAATAEKALHTTIDGSSDLGYVRCRY